MRRFILAGVALCLCSGVQAQQLPPAPLSGAGVPGVNLKLTVEQTKLIVETLGAIGCQNVTQLIVCQRAAELLAEIRRQAAAQIK